ncbi:hypothetical protein EFJ55_24875, partial [Escherichia coli]
MGKGSSKGHTPREAKDNLKSSQMLSVIDAISEGPVEGPVDGLKSVLLNSTPVLDSEPRITCNAYLTTQRKAWDVLSDFCSAMRCMPVWNGQTLTFVQDRPSDKVWTYNRSNVVMPDDGAPFRYSFSALKDRHNAVEVNWIDPNNGWETATELVEDTQAIARYGRNVTKMDAFGCTSRGQAHRAGLWLIKTELLETQTVDFSVGAEGLRHVPGDVIEICD